MSAPALTNLRNWLEGAHLRNGARLPAERTLAAQLTVTRSELRKAMQVLENEGRVQRHIGRGTFLTEPSKSGRGLSAPQLIETLANRTGPHDAMAARLALEPEMARLAALHATPRQLAELIGLSDDMRQATSWPDYEELDAAFHELIAESAGNPLLFEVLHVVNAVRKSVVWGRLNLPKDGPTRDYHSFAEHDAIVAALKLRDGRSARDAMRLHIRGTISTMMPDD